MVYSSVPLLGAGSFRVMHLLAGAADEPIRFSLGTTTCVANPPVDYEALSYAWGDLKLTQQIFFEDSEGCDSPSLLVTTSCYKAIHTLRLADKTRTLWIDAICINQNDVEERGKQVAMMRSIYSSASQVVVYLGEGNNDSDSIMRYVADQYEPAEYPRQEIIPNPAKDVWWSFSSRAWFTRTWILQELFSAQKVEVRCGSLSVSWDALAHNFDQRYMRAVRDEFRKPAADYVVHFMRRSPKRSNVELGPRLLRLLTDTRCSISSDPRDKIYGILSILGTDEGMHFLRPDYRRSANELFTDVALFLYERIGPDMFRSASRYSLLGGLNSLPTWVPDWTCPGVFGMEEADARRASRRFRAGGQPISGAQPCGHSCFHGAADRQLSMKGLRVDSLATISDECNLDKNVFPLEQWLKLAFEPSVSNTRSKTRVESECPQEGKAKTHQKNAFLRLLTYDNVIYANVVLKALKCILKWEKEHADNDLIKHLTERAWAPSLLQQIHQMLKCCDKRKFAVLQNGLLALVPVFAEPEDLVYVLPGASVPFILRKQGDHYLFIGECFVQGIMFGEAWEGKSADALDSLMIE